MSWECPSQSTSKRAHPTLKSLPSLSPLDSQATSEEHSNIGNAGVGGAGLQIVSNGDTTTPYLSSKHVTEDPDLYYPSTFPPLYLSMYTGRQTTDVPTSDSQPRDRHTQYATLRLPVSHHPSAFALPSPDFPCSVGSFPPTATTAEFPPSTADIGIPSYYYGAYLHRDSDLSLAGASKFGLHPRAHNTSSDQLESPLLPSEMRVGGNSGSRLNPARFSSPPPRRGVEPLRIHRQQPPLFQPPGSPVHGGSEVQNPPISPASVQTSRPFDMTNPFYDPNDNEAAFIDCQKESNNSEGQRFSLLLPTIGPSDNASPLRHSFQTHATAGSTTHGHDGSSLPSSPTRRNSVVQFPDQRRWAEVMQSIKTGDRKTQAADANVDRLSVEALLDTRHNSSSNVSQSNLSNLRDGSLAPPPALIRSSSDGPLTSTSATSGSDSFTAFELMSFPQPPTTVPEQGPTTRSPWVKGLTLPMPINTAISRRSIREPGTPTARPLSSASIPTVPALPLSAASSSTPFTPPSAPGLNPTFHVVQTPSRVVVTTYDTPVPTVASPEGSQSLWVDSEPPSPASYAPGPSLQRKSLLSMSAARSSIDGSISTNSECCPLNRPWCTTHLITGVTPSYNRRISALIHATEQLAWDLASKEEPQDRMSKDSDQIGALDRQSEDEPAAVVGIVRLASLSCRSKALLTRAPSSSAPTTPPATQIQHTALSEAPSPTKATVNPLKLHTEDSALRQGDHAYLSKAPSPSFTASTVSPSIFTPSPLKSSPFPQRKSSAYEPGFFPAIVDEVDNQFDGVDRTELGITPLDVRGVSTRMYPEPRPDVTFYNEKVLPPVPNAGPRESPVRSRPLPLPPPLPSSPLSPTPLLPIVAPPAIPPHAHVQPDHTSIQRQESFGSNTLTRVSSLLSKLSNSTLHSLSTTPSRHSMRRSKRGTTIPPPLPPPPLPLPLTPYQMQPPGSDLNPDNGTTGHELMERTRQGWDGHQNQKPLHVPGPVHQLMPQQHAQSSNGKGYVHETALSHARSIRSMFSNRSDRSRHRVPNPIVLGIHAPIGGDGSGSFSELDDDEKRKRLWQVRALGVDPPRPQEAESDLGVYDLDVRGQNAGGPPAKGKSWIRRSKWRAAILLLLALIGLVVGLVVILTRRNPDNQASSCAQSNATGSLCDISTCQCALLYSAGTNSLNRQDMCLHLKRARPL